MSKVLVISSDAMVGEDLVQYRQTSSYRRLFAGGAQVRQVRSIYPSLTLPAHVTMMTGMYPEHHGIASNTLLTPGTVPAPWHWEYGPILCDTVFKAAKQAGRTTAAVFWPVTGSNPDIDYLLADNWPYGPGDTLEKAFRRTGTTPEVLQIVERHKAIYEHCQQKHPERDLFGIRCACDILRQFRPDLMLLHPANIDAVRHTQGIFGPHITKAVEELDDWLNALADAMEEAGVLEETNIFLVSDHGQRNFTRFVSLNVELARAGLIRLDGDGKVESWDAWCMTNGMSALIYLRDPADQGLHDRVYALLQQLQQTGLYGFSRLYTTEEARREEHLGGDFSFVVETDGYTSFGDWCTGPAARPADQPDYHCGRGDHGYLPTFGPQPILLANGPDIRPGALLEQARLVDEAPTYARILGGTLAGTDGRVLEELLR